MRFILLTLLLVTFLLARGLRAQELTPVFENITEGLPSTEVHDIFQDSIGYIWFATDRGICRYDGDKMKIIETEKYFKTNVFFKFFKQTETKVWLLTDKSSLYWFNPAEAKPQFHPHPKNAEIESAMLSSNFLTQISNAKFFGDDIALLFRRAPGYYYIPKKGNCKWFYNQEHKYYSLSLNRQLEIKKSGQIYYTQFNENSTPNPPISIRVGSEVVENNDFLKLFKACDYGISAELETKHGTYLSISERLIRVQNKKVTIVEIPSKILCILESNEKLYIGTYGGIIVCDYDLNVKAHLLKQKTVTKMFLDKNKNFWVSTLQSGLYMADNLKINELKFDFDFNNSSFLNTGKFLVLHDKNKLQGLIIDKDFRLLKRAEDVVILDDRIMFDNPEIVPFLDRVTPFEWHPFPNKVMEWKYGFISSNIDYSFLLVKGAISKIEDGKLSIFYRLNGNIRATFCIELNDSSLLIGSEKGLYKLNTKTNVCSKHPLKGTENVHFYSAINLSGKIIITSDNGIYDYNEGKLYLIPESRKNKITLLHKRNNTSAWAWNDHSIYQLSLVGEKTLISRKKYYSTTPDALINALTEFNNNLWVSTKKGIQLIDLDSYEQKNRKANYTFITDSVLIDSKKWSDLSTISLCEGNTMSLFFSSICFDRSVNRELEYSIDGKTWFETNKNTIVLSALHSGEYVLSIRRIDEPSKLLFSFPIHVSKIWYQSYWFITLCSLITLSFVAFLIFRIFKSRDKKRSSELEKLNLELKLLTSKMNPHFTFNTINSIQYYILKSDKKEAIQYLSDFALLIRKSLEFSMTEQITIQEEVDFLSLYVKLENKRFDSNFHLQFDYQPNNIQHKKIPSMLIQPLVENIILHAGYSEEDDKIIQVKIIYENGYFFVHVIDFGAGITLKKELGKHKSYGIDILKSRVKIYNGYQYTESDVSVSSTSHGTTVKIKLKEWIQ